MNKFKITDFKIALTIFIVFSGFIVLLNLNNQGVGN